MKEWQQKVKEWHEAGVLDQTAMEAIVNYESRQPQKKRIPLLLTVGLIFFTLAIFSFIAANWGLIPDILKTTVILVFMWIAYVLADFSKKRHFGYPIIFQLLGFALFLAAVLVTLQTFHLSVSNTVLPWLAYLAAIGHFYLYKHKLYSGISFIAGIFLLFDFMPDVGWFEWIAFIAVTLAHFYFVRKKEAVTFSFLHLFGAGLLLWVLVDYESALWPIWTLFALTLLIWVVPLKASIIKPLIQMIAGLIGIGYLLARAETDMTLVHLNVLESSLLIVAGGALALFLWKEHKSIVWIALLGLMGFLLLDETAIALAVLAEVVGLGYLIVAQRQDRSLRGGFIFFILIQFVIYFVYAWQRLDMSLFFFIGALLLFVLAGVGWWLNRRKEGGTS